MATYFAVPSRRPPRLRRRARRSARPDQCLLSGLPEARRAALDEVVTGEDYRTLTGAQNATRSDAGGGFFWDDIAEGALGAVVVADTRRLEDCFPAVGYFERRELPFVIAVNCFAGSRLYRTGQVAAALDLDPEIPVVLCDARDKGSAKEVLIALVERVRRNRPAP